MDLPVAQAEAAKILFVRRADRLDLEPLGGGGAPEAVELRAEGVDLGRPLVRGDGPADLGVGRLGIFVERARPEDLLEEPGVIRLLDGRDEALRIGQVLFEGIEERPHGLLGQRVAQDFAGRPAVPEHPADEFARRREVQLGVPAGVGRGRRLAVAEPPLDRALVNAGGLVEMLARPGEADRGAVTDRALLAGRRGEVPVEEQPFAELLHGRELGRSGLGREQDREARGDARRHRGKRRFSHGPSWPAGDRTRSRRARHPFYRRSGDCQPGRPPAPVV